MATLPSFKRIYEQDYPPEYQGLIQQLSVSLNTGIGVIYELLNGKLTFKDNMASTIKELTVQVNANGVPNSKTTIKKGSIDRIEGLMVIRAENLSDSTIYPTSGVFITYTETTENIIVNHITGLQPNNLYKIKVLTVR